MYDIAFTKMYSNMQINKTERYIEKWLKWLKIKMKSIPHHSVAPIRGYRGT
jgi:hypothetical protein